MRRINLKKLSLRRFLLLGLTAVAFLVVGMSVVNILQLNQTRRTTANVLAGRLPQYQAAVELGTLVDILVATEFPDLTVSSTDESAAALSEAKNTQVMHDLLVDTAEVRQKLTVYNEVFPPTTSEQRRFVTTFENILSQVETSTDNLMSEKTDATADTRLALQTNWLNNAKRLHSLVRAELARQEKSLHGTDEDTQPFLANRFDWALNLGWALGIILAATLLVWIFERYVTRLLRIMSGALEQIMAGEKPTRLEPILARTDEVGHLATTIDELAHAQEKRQMEISRLDEMLTKITGEPSSLRRSGQLTEKLESETQRVEELEQTKLAMLNLLEDLEEERNVSRDEAARIETIIASISDGICVVSMDGRFRLMNPTAIRMFGLTGQEVIGRSYAEVLPDFVNLKNEALQPKEHPITVTIMSKKPANGQLNIVRGEERMAVSYRSAPIISGQDTVGVVTVFRDISDEVELDRAKSEFVSVASHQLRTPLTTIKWYAESLSGGDFGQMEENLGEAVSAITESSSRMMQLIDTLLNVSRIESGRLRISPEPCSLPDLVQEIWEENEPAVQDKQLVFRPNFDKQVPEINLDRTLIKVVLQNLLTNAIKYTPAKGKIEVATKLQGENVLVTVKDNGVGIPESQHHKIFQKMFRAENVMKISTDGNGLGLYIAKAVVETSGGKIWFESKENQGTTFYFTLPVKGVAAREGTRTLIT